MSKQTVIPKQPGSHYSDEQRRAVIADYFVTGNITKTADMNNIPRRTVGTWLKSDWGLELLAEVRHEKGEEFDANLTKLIDSAFAEAQDRVENGDFRVNKEGQLIRVPMGGKELVISGATVYDKRQLHRNQPTNISDSRSSREQLQKVLDKCAAINKSLEEKHINSIAGKCTEITDEGGDQSARSGNKKATAKPKRKPILLCATNRKTDVRTFNHQVFMPFCGVGFTVKNRFGYWVR